MIQVDFVYLLFTFVSSRGMSVLSVQTFFMTGPVCPVAFPAWCTQTCMCHSWHPHLFISFLTFSTNVSFLRWPVCSRLLTVHPSFPSHLLLPPLIIHLNPPLPALETFACDCNVINLKCYFAKTRGGERETLSLSLLDVVMKDTVSLLDIQCVICSSWTGCPLLDNKMPLVSNWWESDCPAEHDRLTAKRTTRFDGPPPGPKSWVPKYNPLKPRCRAETTALSLADWLSGCIISKSFSQCMSRGNDTSRCECRCTRHVRGLWGFCQLLLNCW